MSNMVTHTQDEAVVEAMSRLFLAQDALRRLGQRPEISVDVMQVTMMVAEALGWLQNVRRYHG